MRAISRRWGHHQFPVTGQFDLTYLIAIVGYCHKAHFSVVSRDNRYLSTCIYVAVGAMNGHAISSEECAIPVRVSAGGLVRNRPGS